jgi:hypothetical protein
MNEHHHEGIAWSLWALRDRLARLRTRRSHVHGSSVTNPVEVVRTVWLSLSRTVRCSALTSVQQTAPDPTRFPPALLARYGATSVYLRSPPSSDAPNACVPTPTLMVNLAVRTLREGRR